MAGPESMPASGSLGAASSGPVRPAHRLRGGVPAAASVPDARRGQVRSRTGGERFCQSGPTRWNRLVCRAPQLRAVPDPGGLGGMDPTSLTLKLLLVGDSAVGKSSLLLRFTDGAFEPCLKPTIVYDVTRKDTFTGLESWLNELEMYTIKSKTVKMLVGNKTDKPDREVQRKEGLQFARKRSLLFIETSAKTQDGVQHAFEELVIKILQTPGLWDKNAEKQGIQLMESSSQQGQSYCGAYCPLA
ncbi:ras-related protein Rab-18-B-like isoform X2 [Heliangelus exortis]|uniref:ras-related protein Rab-18-B-like isoform X2 n=1 Tax=Heliangelus exortis TaxID=472823 RepID=UPI003A9241A7